VVKVYDLLCYRFIDRFYEQKVYVVNKTEYEIQNEGHAYSALCDAGLWGKAVPKYMGSWTMTLADPTAPGKDLQAHLILMECIEGVLMSEVPVKDLSDATKKAIMVKVMEARTDVSLAGVSHRDFEPYNIIMPEDYESLCMSTSNQNSPLRVCLIDFVLSYVEGTECFERKNCLCRTCIARRNPNPLYFWAGMNSYSQYGWLPDQDEAPNWMWSICGKPTKEQYLPAKRDKASPLDRPLRPDFGRAE